MINRIKSMFWKEWCEVRVYLAIALFIFLGLPAIGALEDRVRSANHIFPLIFRSGMIRTARNTG